MAERRAKTAALPASEIRVDPRRVVLWIVVGCIAAELFFLVYDYFINYGKGSTIGAMRRMANIAREDSLASWFSWTQTFLAGLTAWLVWAVVRAQSATTALRRRGWLTIACFFTYMSLDDGAKFHERMGTIFKRTITDGAESDGGGFVHWLFTLFPSYSWQFVFLPLFGGLAAFILYFLWRDLRDRRSVPIVVAALGCFVFAVGLDFIEGLDTDHPLNLYTVIITTWDFETWSQARFDKTAFEAVRHFSKAIEEAIEMLGNTLLWWVFLRELTTGLASSIRIRLRS